MNVPQDFVGNKKRWEWMHRSKELDLPSFSPQEEDMFMTPLNSEKRRSHITPKRSIKKKRFSANRQLDPVAWSSYYE